MEKQRITVAVPIGPNPIYRDWYREAIDSARNQTVPPDEILLIDDQAHLTEKYIKEDLFGLRLARMVSPPQSFGDPRSQKIMMVDEDSGLLISYWKTPWLSGVATVFNYVVALAEYDQVFCLGSDDTIMPTCLEECIKTFEEHDRKDAWYNVTIITESGEVSWIPNHACMVTKGLWNLTGGFPPSAGVGGPDALLLSILMVHMPDRIIQVKHNEPLYWVREHQHQMTKHDAGSFVFEVINIRNIETERWKPPIWTT